MFCKSYTRAGTKNGKQLVIAELITKTAPLTMPTTTDEIDNINDGMLLAPGSLLMATSPFGFYSMNDEYTWDEIKS